MNNGDPYLGHDSLVRRRVLPEEQGVRRLDAQLDPGVRATAGNLHDPTHPQLIHAQLMAAQLMAT